MAAHQNQKPSIQYHHANEIEKAANYLGRGNWSEYFFATETNLRHDAKVLDSGKWGKDECIVIPPITSEGLQPPKRWDWSRLSFLSLSRARSPIRVTALVPDESALSNTNKNPKEINFLFHEKNYEEADTLEGKEGKRLNFTNAAMMANKRPDDLKSIIMVNGVEDTIENHILSQIRDEIERTHANSHKRASIKLSLGGEGLAGLEAQLVFAALLADLNKPEDESILQAYKSIHDIDLTFDLITIDTVKTSRNLAEETAKQLAEAKQKFPRIRFQGYNLSHHRTQERLGETHILSAVTNPEVAPVIHETCKRDGQLISHENNNTPESSQHLSKKLSNHGMTAFFYRRASVMLVYMMGTYIKNKFQSLSSRFSSSNLSPSEKNLLNASSNEENDKKNKSTATRLLQKHINIPNHLKTNQVGLSKVDQEVLSLVKTTNQLEMKTAPENRLRYINPLGNPPIENLVFEGGGVKGQVYAGALRQLSKHNLYKDVKRVTGSSAGGITATLLACGFSPEQIEPILSNLDFSEMMDSVGSEIAITPFEKSLIDFYHLVNKKGIYKGDAFLKILGNLITEGIENNLNEHFSLTFIKNTYPQGEHESDSNYEKRLADLLKIAQNHPEYQHFANQQINLLKRNLRIRNFSELTFGQHEAIRQQFPELGLKELYMTATDMKTGSLAVFSHRTHPNMQIRHATRATMSFPFAFMPCELNGRVYADAGIANNSPAIIFDKSDFLPEGYQLNESGANPGTLVFLVDSQAEINERWGIKDKKLFEKTSLIGYLQQLISALHSRTDELKERYHTNTIQIFDADTPTMDLSITDEKKSILTEIGGDAVDFYAEHYRHQNVAFDVKYFNTLQEKYRSLSTDEILRHIEYEIIPLINEVITLKTNYESAINKYSRLMRVSNNLLEKLKADKANAIDELNEVDPNYDFDVEEITQEYDALISEQMVKIEEIDDHLSLIEEVPDILQRRIKGLEQEKQIAARFCKQVPVRSQEASQERDSRNNLRFTKRRARKIPKNEQEAILQKRASSTFLPFNQKHFHQATMTIVQDFKSSPIKINENEVQFSVPVDESQSVTGSLKRITSEKTGLFIEKLPPNEAKQYQALMQCYDVMFKTFLKTHENQTIDLKLNAKGRSLVILEKVMNDLQREYHDAFLEKNISVNIQFPARKASRRLGR